MLGAVWLMLSTLLYSLQLSTGSFPRTLTEAEEKHYLELAANGDLEARNILIERNLRLVAHIMKKYYAQTSDQEDLISIGTIGLIKGISTFDASKGARLATYAARCVENEILMYFRSQKRAPRMYPFQIILKRDRMEMRCPLWTWWGKTVTCWNSCPAKKRWHSCAWRWKAALQSRNGR